MRVGHRSSEKRAAASPWGRCSGLRGGLGSGWAGLAQQFGHVGKLHMLMSDWGLHFQSPGRGRH